MIAKAMKEAALETSSTGMRLLTVVAIAVLALSSFGTAQRWHQERTAIYSAPTNVAWVRRPDSLVFSARATKLQPCHVLSDSKVLISARLEHPHAPEPKFYTALGPSRVEVSGNPLLEVGEEFTVGPWLVLDTPDSLDRIKELRVVLKCSFSSGVSRFATIGPILKPR